MQSIRYLRCSTARRSSHSNYHCCGRWTAGSAAAIIVMALDAGISRREVVDVWNAMRHKTRYEYTDNAMLAICSILIWLFNPERQQKQKALFTVIDPQLIEPILALYLSPRAAATDVKQVQKRRTERIAIARQRIYERVDEFYTVVIPVHSNHHWSLLVVHRTDPHIKELYIEHYDSCGLHHGDPSRMIVSGLFPGYVRDNRREIAHYPQTGTWECGHYVTCFLRWLLDDDRGDAIEERCSPWHMTTHRTRIIELLEIALNGNE